MENVTLTYISVHLWESGAEVEDWRQRPDGETNNFILCKRLKWQKGEDVTLEIPKQSAPLKLWNEETSPGWSQHQRLRAKSDFWTRQRFQVLTLANEDERGLKWGPECKTHRPRVSSFPLVKTQARVWLLLRSWRITDLFWLNCGVFLLKVIIRIS